MPSSTESGKDAVNLEDQQPIVPGALDGITIMRYAHVYRSRISGGQEQYLRCLNGGLLERNRLTILQMHLVKEGERDAIEIERVAQGRILWVPVPTQEISLPLMGLRRRMGSVYRRAQRLHEQIGESDLGSKILALPQMLSRRLGHFVSRTSKSVDRLPTLLTRYGVNLLVMHWLSHDSESLVLHAMRTKIPYVFINHFSNTRLSLPQFRTCINNAAAVGVVSEKEIPIDFQGKCTNLSDAVDTEFFAPQKARPVKLPAAPVVLLPARIQIGKGHRDLIKAAALLVANKIDLSLCFAGAVDSEVEHQELRRIVAAAGLQSRVSFLGETTAEELRDLYAASCMVVLPSHAEGLGRVLLEAQAMRKPVIAYDSGGMSQALLHNETGFLVKAEDVEALADKISILLGNEAERLRMGASGRGFVIRNFAIPALIQRHEAFYLKALSYARQE